MGWLLQKIILIIYEGKKISEWKISERLIEN